MLTKLLVDADTELNLSPKKGTTNDNLDTLTNLTLPGIISGLIRGALVVAAIIFFFMLVIGGIRWIASGGDKGATEAARSQITAALVGLVIVFAAWAIVFLINTFFDVNILNLSLPTAK